MFCSYGYFLALTIWRESQQTETGRWIWRIIIRRTGRAIFDLMFLACAMTRSPAVISLVLDEIRKERQQHDALEEAR